MELKIEYLLISDLKPYAKNTRKHADYDVGEIAKSIQKYGFNNPIGIYGDKNIIVEGHGRLMAAQKLGLDTVPCIRLDHMTDKERREYAIMHNKTAELSEWDFDFLKEDFTDLDFANFDVDFGFDDKDDSKKDRVDGEVEFSEELLLTHNYIVLYFDNDFDWEVAQEKFGLKMVKDLIPRKGQPCGIGRVVNGAEILKWQN